MPPCLLLKPSQSQCEQLWQPLSRCVYGRQRHLQLSRMLTSSIPLQDQAGEYAAQAQRLQALFGRAEQVLHGQQLPAAVGEAAAYLQQVCGLKFQSGCCACCSLLASAIVSCAMLSPSF